MIEHTVEKGWQGLREDNQKPTRPADEDIPF